MDRILLYVANAVTLLAGLLAMVLLVLGLIDLLMGKAAAEIWLAIIALAVVPYCFTGTLHRIVGIPGKG